MIEERCDNCKFYEPVDDGMGSATAIRQCFFHFGCGRKMRRRPTNREQTS